jgi:hypothetical protein
VPDDKLDWKIQWDQYAPANFTAPHIKGQSWADPDIKLDLIILFFNTFKLILFCKLARKVSVQN